MGWSRGHCFFSLFVNDIPDTVNAKVKMYADDSKVYERQTESDSLQRDIPLDGVSATVMAITEFL